MTPEQVSRGYQGLRMRFSAPKRGLRRSKPPLMRSNDALVRRKKKRRLIVDVDSMEDPAHRKQENVAFNGHFGRTAFIRSSRSPATGTV